MRTYNYCLWLVLIGLLACDREPDMKPKMVNQYITGEINNRPFESKMCVEMGACVRKDVCDNDVVWINLVRKIEEETYQMVFFEYIHCKPGNYFLKDSLIKHRKDGVCTQESVYAMSSFKAYPLDDIYMDFYQLLEGPWNYLRILHYDPIKNQMQGEFAAKFVRVNKVQHAFDATDTVAYTNCKFTLSNMYVAEPIIEPR